MAERADFYVYALLREDGVTPFYIGKGHGRRVQMHSTTASLKRRSRKNSVARRVMSCLGHIPHEIVDSGLTEAEAFEAEAGLIALLGRADAGGGYLTNMTCGGDGAAGLARTAEDKANKAIASKRLWANPDFRNHVMEQSASEAIKTRRSEVSLARWKCPDYRAKLSATHRARMADPEERRRRAEATRLGIARKRQALHAS